MNANTNSTNISNFLNDDNTTAANLMNNRNVDEEDDDSLNLNFDDPNEQSDLDEYYNNDCTNKNSISNQTPPKCSNSKGNGGQKTNGISFFFII